MSELQNPANLKTTFVIVNAEQSADTLPVTETVWSDMDEKFGNFAGHSLVASFSFDDDWPTWEIHPHGDEVVCLMSGDATMILDTAEGEQRVRLNQPGAFVIVPQATWHTAKVHAPTTMLFVTPGQDTENRETPGSRDG